VLELEYFKIIVTISLAVLGWLVAHYFTAKRDVSNKRRELKLQYLIGAYQVLTNEISHRDPSPERSFKLENILSDIQLYGSEKQVNLANQLATDVAAGIGFKLKPLIESLRDDLRKELHLSKISSNIKWLRFNK
jgi:hypothetical protein